MADVIDFESKQPTTEEALEQALSWVEIAKEGFEDTTIDYVALDGVTNALKAVYTGLLQRKEFEKLGIDPPDRTYRPNGFTVV